MKIKIILNILFCAICTYVAYADDDIFFAVLALANLIMGGKNIRNYLRDGQEKQLFCDVLEEIYNFKVYGQNTVTCGIKETAKSAITPTCTWKYKRYKEGLTSGYEWRRDCGADIITYDPSIIKDFKYCPYCQKKLILSEDAGMSRSYVIPQLINDKCNS